MGFDLRYFLFFLFSLIFCFAIWSLLVFGQSKNPSKMSQWIYDVYEKKIDSLKKIKEQKILIVAGSNAMFGVDSKILSKAFDMKVFNFGVNAGIELPLTLYLAQRAINSGDIVIMPLEYTMYSYDGKMGVQMIDYLVSRQREFFLNLSFQEKLYLLWKIDLKRVIDGYFDKSNSKVEAGLYGYKNIDENGDQIGSDLKYRLDVYFNSISTKPENYADEFNKDNLSWRYLEEFVIWCEKRDVKVYFMPPSLMKNEQYFQADRWYYENLEKVMSQKGFNFVGNPFEYMYDKEYYFDTNYHLINEARVFRTKKMVEDLKEVLK